MSAHPLVYELNTRCWLYELAQPAGKPSTLAEIPNDQFAYWQRLGFTHIWLMGVWSCGPPLANAASHAHAVLPDFRPEDAVPSPYAVTAYDAAASLGGPGGLRVFRKRLREHGLKLILDFVPNHTSMAHPWTREHPEFYVRSPGPAPGCFKSGTTWLAHGKDPYFPPWTDTAQLDYRNSATREAMISELFEAAAECDGLRCDMAMLLLNDVFARTWKDFPSPPVTPKQEFWSDAVAAVRRKFPECLLLAEAYWDVEDRLLNLGFDFVYDKRVYDHLVARNPSSLATHLRSKPVSFLARSCHFLENHDEPRIASLLNPAEHRAASLLILALPGMRLLHEGQLSGATVRASVHLRRRCREAVDVQIQEWYDALLRAIKGSLVGRGEFKVLLDTPEAIFAIRWEKDASRFDLVIVNATSRPSELIFRPGDGAWRVTDLLPRQSAPRIFEGTISFDLPGHAACLLRFERVNQDFDGAGGGTRTHTAF